ncbi:hypothetical protein [Mycobacteroides immunogenum]|uniref:hypothetical protein n=1 Tax=Mycobacteroides immunogenum TaxID=83262 RepID=UPI000A7031FC|nr:hypothetical protein [Mycobacteroides immunogenum]MCV7306807.1 hypothetical protein [Mycobacteroides immunogenum]
MTRFQHYLSYGSTDQVTARDLRKLYDGLLVPGTVAAFQADGTKGFVLTLSASTESKNYIIDPRFPLFQNSLATPKRSHQDLADVVFEDPELIHRSDSPQPSNFSKERCQKLAERWIDFNMGYTSVSSKHFQKYAERLGQDVFPSKSRLPTLILAPYFMSASKDDPWWATSKELFDFSYQTAKDRGEAQRLRRVIAAAHPSALPNLIDDIPDKNAAVWVNDLSEINSTVDDLVAYGKGIRHAHEQGRGLFALYGGYFSVVLGRFGLLGSSHGIGYGEHRQWVELRSTGPAPARYYVRRLHRYVSIELASYLWQHARHLIDPPGTEPPSRDPLSLSNEYHDLMKHSVECRKLEIDVCGTQNPTDISTELRTTANDYETTLETLAVPGTLRNRAVDSYSHLTRWADAIDRIAAA